MTEKKNNYLKISYSILALAISFVFLVYPLKTNAYDPSNILPDSTFIDTSTMSVYDIQNFLNSKGSGLAGYIEPNFHLICNGTYQAQGKSAAQIIWQTANYWGLNPQVVLATLEKEQVIITGSLTQYKLDFAMGWNCNEGTGCYDGMPGQYFPVQVNGGTWQLKNNYLGAKNTPNALFPTAWCSGFHPYCVGDIAPINGGIYIGNGATGSLYRYTPHEQSRFYGIFSGWFSVNSSISPVYRFYNISNGTHFYTASVAERDNVGARWGNIYRYEGVVYNLTNNGQNVIQLYRFWNNNGTHFYTNSPAERDNIVARWPNIYRYEGVAYYVAVSGSPVYRFYNISNGTHFYTASVAERDNVGARWGNIYRYEGVAFYVQ